MTRTDPLAPFGAPLEEIIAHFGLRRVLLAALGAQIARHRARPLSSLVALDDHLRRDIGLPPKAASPPPLPDVLTHLR